MIEPEPGFFQMQVKGVLSHAVELHHPSLGIPPEALNAVDVNWASAKFIVAVVDPQVLVKADIDQAIVATPASCVNDAGNDSLVSTDGLQRAFRGNGHDLGADAVTSLEQSKHDRLSTGTRATKTPHAARTKVRLIGLQLPA